MTSHFDRRTFLATTAGAALAGALPAAAQAGDLDRQLTAFLDAEYETEVQMDPEELTSQGRKEQYDHLTDRSEAHGEKVLAWRRGSVARMKAKFDPARLGEEARTSYDMWILALDQAELRNRWRRHRYVFSRGAAHVGLPNFLINFHRVDTPADAEAYIARIGRIDAALDQMLVRARAAAAEGVRMPRFDYVQGQKDLARVTAGAPFSDGPDSPMYADFRKKVAALKDAGKLDDARADALVKAAAAAMTGRMKPAYDRVGAWLAADVANTTPEARGAGALPDGRAYYDAALKLQTTTDMTAEEIHQLGLSEVARIRGEMEAVKAKTGFTGALPEFFVFMRTDKRFYLPNTDEGRAEYLRLADGYLAGMKKKLPAYFGILPKADLVVKRVEAFREIPGAAQHYFPGTPDGSRPGIFYSHLSDMSAMPTYQLENIAYHEGLPGHHMQISIAQELTGVPKFRTQYGYTAYSEGWGLYSEALAKEMGFDVDPYNDFGRLSGEIWRAIRLVVDTGIHAKGWSEEQAVAYFLSNSAQPEAAVRAEIQRYFLNPGQANCYKIGMIRIQKLRDKARSALGARFDYRTFHDTVLGGGSQPMPILEARVNRWLAKQEA
ncbi:DUF885 family protein [Phenylobacterium sp.]|uniref:DUF885 domain-containing protein n=1 Tax=Phenylobacterium sp. TaxID=1871053 RepID=UPI0025E22D45|nr:DUF885 domain-containing protein [Phenylobacterium sp.]MBX3484735.1 DUF885 domain-containing protein [Phenylobacterium sp.]